MNGEIEAACVRAFIVPRRRAQYLARLSSAKTRLKFMNAHLFHMRDLDLEFAHRLKPGEQNPTDVLRLLRERGAPDHCYVISGSSDHDGEEVDLSLALEDIFAGRHGTFVVCIPGRLAYFQGEEPGEGYVLERPRE